MPKPKDNMILINKEQYEDIEKKIEEGYGLKENIVMGLERGTGKEVYFHMIKHSEEPGDITIVDLLKKDIYDNRFYVNKDFFNEMYNMQVP